MCVHLQADPLCVGPPSVVASHPWHVERHVEHVARYHDDSDGEDDINGDNENDGGEDNDKKTVEGTWLPHLDPGKAAISDKVFTSRTKKAYLQLLVELRVERKHLDGGEAEDSF